MGTGIVFGGLPLSQGFELSAPAYLSVKFYSVGEFFQKQ